MFDFNKKQKRKERTSMFAMLGIGAASVLTAMFLSDKYKPNLQKGSEGVFAKKPWSFSKMATVVAVVIVLMVLVQVSGLEKYFKTSLFDPLEQKTIVEVGESYLGKPYCLGGTGPDCFDCSGYVISVMQSVGITDLPRRSRDQATIGEPISLSEAGIGDLVFFYTNPSAPNTISHVGILATSDGKFLNANSWTGRMQYDDLNVAYWRDRFAWAREIQISGREKVPVEIVPEEEVDTTDPEWGDNLPPSEEVDERIEPEVVIPDETVVEDESVVAAEVEETETELVEEELDEVQVEDFPDVSPDHPRYQEILYLKEQGIVNGYADGSFKPTGRITRAELLKIVMGARGLTPSGESDLSDVQGHWVEPYVATAKKLGIIGGYPDGTFRPNDQVSLVEAAKITLNTLNVKVPDEVSDLHFKNIDITAWYAPYLKTIYEQNLLDLPGDSVDPDTKLLRQDMAVMIYRVQN